MPVAWELLLPSLLADEGAQHKAGSGQESARKHQNAFACQDLLW